MGDDRRENQPVPTQEGADIAEYYHERQWSGPLPPPWALAELDSVLPGLAREVVDEFRAEAKHRRKCEARTSWLDLIGPLLGQILAGFFAAGCFATIWHALDLDAYWIAGVLGGTTIVGGLLAFMSSRVPRETK